MSEDTDARPDELEDEEPTENMTEDEKAEFRRLHTKHEALKATEAAEAQKERDEEVAEAAEEALERQRYHVVIRHIGRGAKTKTLRAARSGHRRKGVLLDDGTRIRMKGRQRAVQVSIEKFADNHRSLLEYVRVGQIEVCDPINLAPIPYADLLDLVMQVGQWVSDKRQHETAVAYDAAIDKYNEKLDAYEEARDKWSAAAKEAKKSGARVGPKPTPPVEPEEPDLEKAEFKLDPEVKYPDEPVEKMPSEYREDPPEGEDATLRDVDAAAMMAAADQAEAKKRGEANTPAGGDEVLTEADLKKMNRPELDELAKGNDLDPSKYSNMGELIDALLSLGEE